MTEEFKALELALAQLNKQYGEGSVMYLGDKEVIQWPAISTGALSLDKVLEIGGLPIGRVVEIYGTESSGKTTLALSVVAEAQKLGYRCAYIDAEHAIDPIYAKDIGVHMEELTFSQPDHGEMAFNIAEGLIKTGIFKVLVIDSVAALIPLAELKGDMEDNHPGLQARMMNKGLRKVVSAAAKNDTMLIFINQLRHKIGVMFGSPETRPGGMGLRYAASVIIDLRKIEDIKTKDGDLEGIKVKARIRKSKIAPPLKEAEFDILYGRGINSLGCIVDVAAEKGILEKKGTWYNYQGEVFAQGRTKAIERLAEDLDLTDKIKEMIKNGTQ